MSRDTLAALRAMTPAQAAAQWIDDDRESPAQQALFEQWLNESEDNRKAWRVAQATWAVFDDADDNALISAIRRAALKTGPEPTQRWWPALLAASVAIAALMGFLAVGRHGDILRPSASSVVAQNTDPLTRVGDPDFVTAAGQKSIVDLPDGTRVTLDASSAVDVAFADGRRSVRLLSGHAFFDVAHDPDHPFSVEAAGRTVTALGTQFDVKLAADTVRVVLAEGSVSVASPSVPNAKIVKLVSGQAFQANNGASGAVQTVDVDETLAWKDGFVDFREQTLADAVAKLNHYTRAQIVIRDPKVAALHITGRFRTGDIKRFGRSLSVVLPVKVVARDPNTYEIIAAGKR